MMQEAAVCPMESIPTSLWLLYTSCIGQDKVRAGRCGMAGDEHIPASMKSGGVISLSALVAATRVHPLVGHTHK